MADTVKFVDCDIESATCEITTYKFSFLPLEKVLPLFLILILIELAFHFHREQNKSKQEKESRQQKDTPYFRLNDSISSLACGVCEVILSKLVLGMVAMYFYAYVYHYWRLFELPTNPIRWSFWWFFLHGLTFFLKDHQYYWFHRAIHEINVGWASHAPHHSSEEYNLTTSLRQGHVQPFFSWPFYLPMALIGIPPGFYAFHTMINLIYQFWIHTRVIDRFPEWFEAVFNTPSHHRVHHGSNPYCIDSNYGGTLIIFDKIYGTFSRERKEEPVVYGLVHPLQTFNPLFTETHHFQHIATSCISVRHPKKMTGVVLKGPGWNPEDGTEFPVPPKDPFCVTRYDPQYSLYDKIYKGIHFGFIFLSALSFIMSNQDSFAERAAQYVYCFWYLVTSGFINDQQRRPAFVMECIRCFSTFIFYFGLWNVNDLGFSILPTPILQNKLIGTIFLTWNLTSLLYMTCYYCWKDKPTQLSKFHDFEHQPIQSTPNTPKTKEL